MFFSYCFRTKLELEETKKKQKRALENENSRLSDLIQTFSIKFKHSPHLISAFKDSLSKMAYKLMEQCIKKSKSDVLESAYDPEIRKNVCNQSAFLLGKSL